MELKEISRTAQNITDTYLRVISDSEYEDYVSAIYQVVNSDLDRDNKTSWISEYIGTKAKNVAIQTGIDYQDVLILVKEQFIINAINNSNKDAKFIKKTVEYSAMYVQSVLFSDLGKLRELIKGQAFINEDDLQPTSVEITINATKRANAEALLSQQINRKDQLAFITKVLEIGKDATKAELGLSERDFNKKFERGLKTIAKYQASNSEEFEYLQALVNELIMTDVSDVELTLDDEIEEVYNESVRV